MTEQHVQAPPDGRTISELVTDAGDQTRRLIRDEIRLATLEMQSKGKRFGKGAGLAGAGSLLAFYGGAALVAAAVIALAMPLPDWAAALIVGAALLLVGAVLAWLGGSDIKNATPPVPEQAAASVQQDIETIKDRSRQ
ncbi:phage holin family protein [Nocardia blacklockiae]|uniref:phage holin family protein n=1 Tax=Nocardia blacklockiae TaxID=480036 RepID=UPI0018942388|nr:phage holin family protein [Nocardia blacklockiae]MBF6175315.1 phage holin family protein [Nocardia blacklockiae]